MLFLPAYTPVARAAIQGPSSAVCSGCHGRHYDYDCPWNKRTEVEPYDDGTSGGGGYVPPRPGERYGGHAHVVYGNHGEPVPEDGYVWEPGHKRDLRVVKIPEAHYLHGLQAFDRGDWKSALHFAEQALRHDPGNSGYQRLIDQCLHKQELERKQRSAREAYVNARRLLEVGLVGDALSQAQFAMREVPGDGTYRGLVGEIQLILIDRHIAKDNYEQAMRSLDRGFYVEAIITFDIARKRDPSNERYDFMYGLAVRRRNEARQAKVMAELLESARRAAADYRAETARGVGLDRVSVPSPAIIRKRYVQLAPADGNWSKRERWIANAFNAGLVKAQDGADWVRDEAVDRLKGWTLEQVEQRVPGVRVFRSIKGEMDRLYEGVSDFHVTMYSRNMDSVRLAVESQGGGLEEFERRSREEEGFWKEKLTKLIGVEIREGAGGGWSKAIQTDSSDEPRRVVPVRRTVQFRLDRWRSR